MTACRRRAVTCAFTAVGGPTSPRAQPRRPVALIGSALIARHDGRVVAVAGFDGLREPRAAEVAFAVADDFQRRGAGTRMLEQLAEIAAERGINRFDAEVMFDNRAMLGVFEGAGFAVRRRGSFGELTVSLDITPTEAVLERIDERDHFAAVASLRPILAPSSVAVVGAAATPGNLGRAVLANIVAGGFRGRGDTRQSRGRCGVLDAGRSQPRRAGGRSGARDHRRRGRRRARVRRRGGRERSKRAAGAPRPVADGRRRGVPERERSGCWRSSGARACGWSGRARWGCSTPPPRSA